MAAPSVERLTRVEVPVGGRAVIASDLFLEDVPTRASSEAAHELAGALGAVEGGGAFVVAGNFFRLEHGDAEAAERALLALEAHGTLGSAIEAFLAAPERRVILLPGTRDREICFDTSLLGRLASLGIEVALEVELAVKTAAGTRLVKVEPGWSHDKRNAFSDPRDPRDTPLGHHAATELFPALASSRTGWLQGIERLEDPAGLGRFVASRLAYRRVGRYVWWLLIPVLVAVVARLPALWLFGAPAHLHGLARPLTDAAFTLLFELVAALVLLVVLNRRIWRGPGSALLGPPADRSNDQARDEARRLVASGYAGLVTGHTLSAELSNLGRGLYANTGACAEVVREKRGLFGLPPVFVADEQASFVEIEGGADLHARLCLAATQQPAGTVLERLVAGRRAPALELSVVASYPGGANWPPLVDPTRRRRLVRRLASAVVGLIGLADVVSALVPVQVRGRLHPYLGYVPLGASALAGALDALSGVALLLIARGLRRGHRLAWAVAVTLLGGTALLHLLREGQVVESAAALVVLCCLVWARSSFRTRLDLPSMRNGLLTLFAGAIGVTALSAAVLEGVGAIDPDGSPLPWGRAFVGSAERLIGIDAVALPHAVTVFLDPALVAIALGLAAVALFLVFRPVVDRRRAVASVLVAGSAGACETRRPEPGPSGARSRRTTRSPSARKSGGVPPAAGLEAAREIVARRGGGTLDYFALRSDKQHFFDRDGVVAFAVHSGVCLVSPDPIGPREERRRLWSGFRSFADERGWAVAVLAAGQDWLPVYRSAGMRSLYIGDEAVVDVRTLSLDGGSKKGLRQAVNRIAKYGYTISFHDPASLDGEMVGELRGIMELSRRGGVERGFSMTLGRIFDPEDKGLLLAVARGPQGRPVAFCQLVPAPGIEGYSLDLMRRDPGDHPNGLFDFVLVRTMTHLREAGYTHLGLNFAMMRAVLAGETGDGLSTKLERWLLRRMSESMQIESLWRFNAKFDPEWLPRYVAWDSAEQSLATALAIARAESFWELPLIGRFLVPEKEAVEEEAPSTGTAMVTARGA